MIRWVQIQDYYVGYFNGRVIASIFPMISQEPAFKWNILVVQQVVSTRLGTLAYGTPVWGTCETTDGAKRAVKRAWDRWLKQHGLMPAPHTEIAS